MTKNILKAIFLIFLIVATFFILKRNQAEAQIACQENTGHIFGTTYKIVYQAPKNMGQELHELLKKVDASLSMFNKESTLYKINQNQTDTIDDFVNEIFLLSQWISQQTNGAFDCTVAPAVNAWGFGFKNQEKMTPEVIDSLKQIIGYQRIKITEDGRLLKEDPRMMIDFSAIAKGFGVDVISTYLTKHNVKNYLVEIGGEIIAKGHNAQGLPWKIGIQDPESSTYNKIINVTNKAMATSGNYRNYYVTTDGQVIAHTIDPHTAQPVQHSLLSATVFAPSCAMADAFATAFMVMGIDKAKQTISVHGDSISAYFIYRENDSIKTYMSQGFGK